MILSLQSNKLFIPKNLCDKYYSFKNCENLEKIEVEAGHPNLYSVDNCLFYKNNSELILGCQNSKLPYFMTKISYPAFYQREGIKKITLPPHVIEIGYSSFAGCDIKAIKLSENLKKIQENAFLDCASLTLIDFSPYIEKIGSSAFRGCKSLSSLELPDSVNKIGSYAFEGCENLKTVYLPDKLSRISIGMFQNCKNLKTVYIPDSVSFISNRAFYGCSSLEYIKLPKSDDKIRTHAFCKCSNLKFVEIPYGVKEIQSRAFYDCDALQTIYIPSSVTKISYDAFNSVTYSPKPYSLTIFGAEGSYAEMFAKRNEYDFVCIKEDDAFPLVCPKCETKIVKNANFCHICGTKIKDYK